MKLGRTILCTLLGVVVVGSVAGMAKMTQNSEGKVNWKTYYETESKGNTVAETPKAEEAVQKTNEQEALPGKVIAPEIDEQLLTVNKWSRPGKKTKKIKYIVVHYLGNPRTTAQENRDYFESLKDLKNVSMSANFVVGLDGEIIECVPDGEVAYASNSANKESISIENCNIDETGKFIKDTYISLVKLTAYLADKYELGREGIIRHHDVTGKDCPLFYVENEEAWEAFLDDVMTYMELCKTNSEDLNDLEHVLKGIKYTYDSKFDGDIVSVKDGETEEAGKPHDLEDGYDGYEEEEEHYDEDNDSSRDDYNYDDNDSGDNYSDNNYSDDNYSDNNYSDNGGYYENPDTGNGGGGNAQEPQYQPPQTEAPVPEDIPVDNGGDTGSDIEIIEEDGGYTDVPILEDNDSFVIEGE